MENIIKLENFIINKNSVPITNNPKLLKKLIDIQMNAYENNKINLSQNLVGELTKLFGKQNTTLRLEFMMKLWVLKYNNIIYNVYTAKGKGTSIEICDYSYDDINKGIKENEIIEFLEELYKQVNICGI